jgi:hypothetical protein
MRDCHAIALALRMRCVAPPGPSKSWPHDRRHMQQMADAQSAKEPRAKLSLHTMLLLAPAPSTLPPSPPAGFGAQRDGSREMSGGKREVGEGPARWGRAGPGRSGSAPLSGRGRGGSLAARQRLTASERLVPPPHGCHHVTDTVQRSAPRTGRDTHRALGDARRSITNPCAHAPTSPSSRPPPTCPPHPPPRVSRPPMTNSMLMPQSASFCATVRILWRIVASSE